MEAATRLLDSSAPATATVCREPDVRIDLHTHSTASDGTDTPAELVGRAATEGLDVVALTDHDTVAGHAEARAALLERRPPRFTGT